MPRQRNEFVHEVLLPFALLAVLLVVAFCASCSTPEQRKRFLSSVELFASTSSGTTDWTTREGDVESTQVGVKLNPFAGLEPPQRIIIEREAPPVSPEVLDAAMRSALLAVPSPSVVAAAMLQPDMLGVPREDWGEFPAYLEARAAGATTPARTEPASASTVPAKPEVPAMKPPCTCCCHAQPPAPP